MAAGAGLSLRVVVVEAASWKNEDKNYYQSNQEQGAVTACGLFSWHILTLVEPGDLD
jgi:hypothetical protein